MSIVREVQIKGHKYMKEIVDHLLFIHCIVLSHCHDSGNRYW